MKADGTIAAEAEAVVVPRDPDADRSRPLTERSGSLLQAELDRDAEALGVWSGSTRRPWTKWSRYQPSPTHMMVTPPGVLEESSAHPLPMNVST